MRHNRTAPLHFLTHSTAYLFFSFSPAVLTDAKNTLHQLRWLEQVHQPQSLAEKLLDVISFQPMDEQLRSELISSLPEIVDDTSAQVCILKNRYQYNRVISKVF